MPTSDTFARPFNLSFDPDLHPSSNNYCSCPYSTIGADIIITHSISWPQITLTADVQFFWRPLPISTFSQVKRASSCGVINFSTPMNNQHAISGESVIKDILDANTILLPFAINPHGRWGPITQFFLNTPMTPSNALHLPTTRPHANTMYHWATTFPAPSNILHSANKYWKCNKAWRYYGHLHSALTLEIHTLHNLGLGIVKAFSIHM